MTFTFLPCASLCRGCAKLQRATQGMHWIYKWPGQDGRLPPPRKGPRPSLFAGDEDAEAESPDKAVPADAQVPRSETEQEVVVVAKLPHPAGWYGVVRRAHLFSPWGRHARKFTTPSINSLCGYFAWLFSSKQTSTAGS